MKIYNGNIVIIIIKLLLFQSETNFLANGEIINTCTNLNANSSRIYCGPGHSHTLIALHSIFASANIVKYLLENCNGRYICNVPNLHGACLQGIYGCTEVTQTLQLTESPSNELTGVAAWFGLMSKGYLEEKYQDAENIQCELRCLNQPFGHWDGIQFDIYELAPFANSNEFCLRAADVEGPISCSGTKRMYEFKRFSNPRDIKTGWQFNLTLPASASHIPKVRFWLGIRVWPHGGHTYKLVCKSHPVSLEACGGDLLEPRGVITSPFYPKPSLMNRECEWNITLDEGKTVTLLFTDFNLRECTNCSCQSVKVYDGKTQAAKLLGTFCGHSLPGTINSTGNNLRIVFKSGVSQHTGFQAAYYASIPAEPFLGNVSKDDSSSFNLFIPVAAGFSFLAVLFAAAFLWAVCRKRRSPAHTLQLQPMAKIEPIPPIPPIIDSKDNQADYYEITDYDRLSKHYSGYLEPVSHYQELTPPTGDKEKSNLYAEPIHKDKAPIIDPNNQTGQEDQFVAQRNSINGQKGSIIRNTPIKTHEYMQILPNALRPSIGLISEDQV